MSEEYIKVPQATKTGWVKCVVNGVFDMSYVSSKNRRGRTQSDGRICPTLCACEPEIVVFLGYEEC